MGQADTDALAEVWDHWLNHYPRFDPDCRLCERRSSDIPLRIVETPQGNWEAASPGEMWPCPNVNGIHDPEPGEEDRGPCWVIRLPGRAHVWHTNELATDGKHWVINGAPPYITVHPSISVDYWHGFITKGGLWPTRDDHPRLTYKK